MQKVNFKNSIKAGVFAAGLAVTINVILFYIFHSTGVLDDNIKIQPNTPLTVLPVIILSILPTMIASIVFFLLEKYTNNGFIIFATISVVLGLISFYSPFNIPNVTKYFAIVLDFMHIVVVVPLIYFIKKEVNARKYYKNSN